MFLFRKITKLKYFLVLIFFASCLTAQVKIGENPSLLDGNSILELESTTKAFVVSRVTEAQMQAILPLAGAVVYNTDATCLFYFDGILWNNLCQGSSALQVIENGDGTYTIDTGNGTPISFNGAPETTTTLEDNGDGTYMYTNETGVQTSIVSGGGSGTSITDNGDGTFTVDDGVNPTFLFNGAPETNTALINNGDGTYTYTNEMGAMTTISVVPLGSQHFGTEGSIFFANSTTGEPTQDNGQFFWDNVQKRLGIGTTTPRNTLEVNGLTVTNRISNSGGTEVYPAYHFQNSSDTGMWSPTPGDLSLSAAGSQVVRVTSNQRVGIEQPNPQATLHVGGDLIVDGTITNGAGTTLVSKSQTKSNSIKRTTESQVRLTQEDNTVILEKSVRLLHLPKASKSNAGHMFIIKNIGNEKINLSVGFRNRNNLFTSYIKKSSVTWLQSDGLEWQQIN